MRRVVATDGHEIPERSPLRLSVGDDVEIGKRDKEWSEFVFVTATHGSGWVPARHLSAATGSGVALTAYDTTELPTAVGDLLFVVSEDLQSEWLWCRSVTGREGWVPTKTISDVTQRR